MVRQPYLKKGTWSRDEDQKLIAYIVRYGIWNWNEMPKHAGLQRSGKSSRLRWMNYLRPNIRRGNFTREEEETIIRLQKILGNRWSAIAARLPQRTDNDIKNYWNTRLKKRVTSENKNSTAATTSTTETNSSMVENSSDTDSSLMLTNILLDSPVSTIDDLLEPPAYSCFSPSGSNLVAVDDKYSMGTDNYLVSCWETQSYLEQPQMIEGLDWEAVLPNSELSHSHHQQNYVPLDDFWVNPLI
ncbi:hypothetical protein ERO13_A13G095600v2 [Gossypium hirsutum]|uniref:Transcription factor MYB106 n=1 Tax=Gossypium hirsutum TaxID=3635 RepID=A0A1U8IBH5_GOSHI|nr:transcription factor MYB106-like [Gossypium hirsutum]KAG4166325.1 hypothetical protein ERO13_A13G095600v2 [Gossypium hirsutum]